MADQDQPSSKRARTEDGAAAAAPAPKGALGGKVAIVTGGGGGIGRAICQRFAREGAHVVVADINDAGAAATVAAIEASGGKATAVHVDCCDDASIKAMVDGAAAALGRIDVLVNNAVRFVFGHLKGAGTGSGTGTDRDVTASDWEKVWPVNILRNTFSDRARCIAQLRPGSSFLLSAPRFLDRTRSLLDGVRTKRDPNGKLSRETTGKAKRLADRVESEWELLETLSIKSSWGRVDTYIHRRRG